MTDNEKKNPLTKQEELTALIKLSRVLDSGGNTRYQLKEVTETADTYAASPEARKTQDGYLMLEVEGPEKVRYFSENKKNVTVKSSKLNEHYEKLGLYNKMISGPNDPTEKTPFLLLGKNEEEVSRAAVYIGISEAFLKKFHEHSKTFGTKELSDERTDLNREYQNRNREKSVLEKGYTGLALSSKTKNGNLPDK